MKTNPRVWVLLTRRVDDRNYYLVGKRGPQCRNPGQWGLFGGNVDAGETRTQAVVRELFEETRLTVPQDHLVFLFKDLVKSKPVTWFAAEILPKPTAVPHITKEIDAYAWADNSWADRTDLDLHYSLQKLFEWMRVARNRSILDTHGVLTDLSQRGLT